MAAMAQEMLRSGEPDQLDAWAKAIGISKSEIFLYRALVPKKLVQTFDASIIRDSSYSIEALR